MRIHPVAAKLFQADVQTQMDRHNLADSHFLQFCERTKKKQAGNMHSNWIGALIYYELENTKSSR